MFTMSWTTFDPQNMYHPGREFVDEKAVGDLDHAVVCELICL